MKLITYPARPVNGGPLPLALPNDGEWFYEPKYNGWRALVHVPTGTMFERHGKLLTIAAEFADALAILGKHRGPAAALINGAPLEWLDCEALERRHTPSRSQAPSSSWTTVVPLTRGYMPTALQLWRCRLRAVHGIPLHKELNNGTARRTTALLSRP